MCWDLPVLRYTPGIGGWQDTDQGSSHAPKAFKSTFQSPAADPKKCKSLHPHELKSKEKQSGPVGRSWCKRSIRELHSEDPPQFLLSAVLR